MININRCPSAAQNLGIHNAKGEYLVFLVAGDFWHPNKLKQQIETMVLDTSITMTLSCYLIFSEGTGPTIKVVTFASIEKLWSGWLEMTVIPVD